MFYYLSLGTNIQPEENAANMVTMLAKEFGPLITYPFVYTEPENIATKNLFLNSLAIVYSSLPQDDIKTRLNHIEEQLGRDRDDPDKSTKDRTADIDILGKSADQINDFFSHYTESYIINIAHLNEGSKVFTLPVLASTERPTTIDFDRASGNIRIVDNGTNRLKHWHKSALEL